MTCVVGLLHNNTIYMGADSAVSSGDIIESRIDEKIFLVKKQFLIGFTSSFRMGQLLRFAWRPPRQKKSYGDYQYMCTHLIKSIINCFEEGGFGGRDGAGSISGGTFLIGYNKQLYKIDSDFQVGKNIKNYCAIGYGESFALGSLYSTQNLNIRPTERVRLALEASAEFCAYVKPPFVYLKL